MTMNEHQCKKNDKSLKINQNGGSSQDIDLRPFHDNLFYFLITIISIKKLK